MRQFIQFGIKGNNVLMNRRSGTKFTFNEVDENKEIVSMIEYQGSIFVATQKGVYKIVDDKMARLEFVEKATK